MIINGDGGYGLLVAYIGGRAAQAGWLGPKVGGHLAPLLYSSREPSELSQWLFSYDDIDSTINIVVIVVVVIIIIIIIIIWNSRSIKFFLGQLVHSVTLASCFP